MKAAGGIEPEAAQTLPTRTGTLAVGPRPLSQLSAVELVVEEVRRAIVTGHLAPGSSVQIGDLTAELGVSHIPVREALRRLEGDGLLTLSRGRQARVAPLSRTDARDVFHHLELLEVDTIGRAVPLSSDAVRAAITRAWSALEVTPDDDLGSISLRHSQFHQLLAAPACGIWDSHLLPITWMAAARYMYLTLDQIVRQGPYGLRDLHSDLALAVTDGSPAQARAATREHIAFDLALVEAELAARVG